MNTHVVKVLTDSQFEKDLQNEMHLLIKASHELIIEISSIFYKEDDPSKEICFSMPIFITGDMNNNLLIEDLEN